MKALKGRALPKSIWVVGSFARGAATCGDLDLVLDVELICTYQPSYKVITKHIIGRYPDVRTYIGTPEENSSHVAFEDAWLLWSKEYPDWETALSRLPVNTDAGRYSRDSDSIPLRSEQYYCQDPKELVELHKQGVLIWEWVPLGTEPPVFDEGTEKYLSLMTRDRSRKYTELARHALSWVDGKEPGIARETYIFKGMPLRLGGVEFVISPRPGCYPGRLDSIACHTLAIMPYNSRRGPNGMWLLRRGPNHWLVETLADVHAYVATDKKGLPLIVDTGRYNLERRTTLSLAPKNNCVRVGGCELLHILARVQSIQIGNEVFKYSEHRKTAEEEPLINYLRSKRVRNA